MLSLNPKDLSVQQVQRYLQNAIAPRPICFASTISAKGEPNLSPFSFFNLFSSNPPVAVFSPAYSGRTGTSKNTLDNVKEVPEVVINVVTYSIVHQTSLASSPFAKGVNEFIKANLTPVESELIQPLRVKESPVQMECKVTDIIELGKQGGAGNLVICEILRIHISEDVLNEQNQIDTRKIDLVARMGDNWYCRASGEALFEVEKPITSIGIGIDQLPAEIKNSSVLTGNNLAMLASVESIPVPAEEKETAEIHKTFADTAERHQHAKDLLDEGQILKAWQVLL